MPLKDKLIKCATNYKECDIVNKNNYDDLVKQSIYKDQYFTQALAFKNYLCEKVEEEKIVEFIKEVTTKQNFEKLKERAEKNGIPISKGYYVMSIIDQFIENPDKLCNLLTLEQQQEAERVMDNAKNQYFLKDEELEPPSLSNEIDEIKNNLSLEDKEKYNDVLEYAKRMTFKHEQYSFQSTFAMKINGECDHANILRDEKVFNDKYENVIDLGGGIEYSVKDNSSPLVKEFQNEKIEPSEELKNIAKEAFEVFSEIEKDTGIEANAKEEKTKIYGFYGYIKARNDLFKAVENKDIKEIEKCVNQHKKAMGQLEKLEQITKKLDPDKMAFVGNIDVSRNSDMPIKYIKDMPTASKINTLFILYSMSKSSKLPVDEFLKNPSASFEKILDDDIKNESDLNNFSKNEDNKPKTISEMLNSFNGIMKGKDREIFSYGFARGIDSIHSIEPNQEAKKKQIYGNKRLSVKHEFVRNFASRNLSLFTLAETEEKCAELLANYYLFSDDKRDYNLLNSHEGYYNPTTFEYVQPFNRVDYIKNNDIDLKEIINRMEDTIENMIINPKDQSKSLFTSNTSITHSISKLSNDLLRLKSNQKETEEYQKLLKLKEDPISYYCKEKQIDYDKIDALKKVFSTSVSEKLFECGQRFLPKEKERNKKEYDYSNYNDIKDNTVFKDEFRVKLGAIQDYFVSNVEIEKLDNYLKEVLTPSEYKALDKRAKSLNVDIFSAMTRIGFANLLTDDITIPNNATKLASLLTPKQQEEISNVIDGAHSEFFMDEEELETPSFEKEIDDIKNNLLDEEKEKYNDILEYAKKATFKHDTFKFQNDLSSISVNGACGTIERKKLLEITNRKYRNVLEQNSESQPVIKNYSSPLINDLKNESYNLSNEFKDVAKSAFDIFEQMEKDSGIEMTFEEQQTKIYGFFGYIKAKEDLEKAIQSSNINEIEKCVENHKKAMEQLEKLSNLTDRLNQSQTAFVTNIDVSRNPEMPMKFIKDMPRASKINSLYMMYVSKKKSGLSTEEFLDDPAKATLKEMIADVNKHSDLNRIIINSIINQNGKRPKTISEVLKLFAGKSEEVTDYPERRIQLEGIQRGLYAIHLLEPDSSCREKNMLAYESLCTKMNIASTVCHRNISLFTTPKLSDNRIKNCTELLGNYYLFSDDKRDYNKLNSKEGFAHPKSFDYTAPFDRARYLQEHQLDLANITERMIDTIDKMIINPTLMAESPFTSEEVIIGSIKGLAMDIIEQRKDLANNFHMETLKKLANNPVEVCKKQKEASNKLATKHFKDFEKQLIKKEKEFEKNLLKAANGEAKDALKEERIESLKQDYKNGLIPAKYLIDRCRQIKFEITGKIPPLFEADKYPSMKEYAKLMKLEELSSEELKDTYDAAKERAKFEKMQHLEKWNDIRKGKEVDLDDPDALLEASNVIKYSSEAKASNPNAFLKENEKDTKIQDDDLTNKLEKDTNEIINEEEISNKETIEIKEEKQLEEDMKGLNP